MTIRLPRRLAFLDLETTGTDASRDRITEVGIVWMQDGSEAGEWSTLVNPGVAIPPPIQALTGIDNAMVRIKPGATTSHIAEAFPTAQEFGFPDETSAFGLQFAHGLGLALHERPIISRVVSMDHPTEIKEGMVFAIETYCPATDGYSGARIEEEVVVTDKGCKVITLFPAEELPITHRVTSITDGATPAQRVITMKGDANALEDPAPYTVTSGRIVLFSVPGIATIIVGMGNPFVLGGITVAAAVLVVWAFWPRERARR